MEKSNEILSLRKHCIPCSAYCCKISRTIGSPILSEDEKKNITKFYEEKYKRRLNCFKRIEVGNEYYYIIKEKNGDCYFLDNNNCKIQEVKPLDCLAYPIKAIYENNNISLVIDTECPAANFLSSDFIKQAKRIAIKSIKRFSPQIYNNWLDNYVGWIISAKKLNKVIEKHSRES